MPKLHNLLNTGSHIISLHLRNLSDTAKSSRFLQYYHNSFLSRFTCTFSYLYTKLYKLITVMILFLSFLIKYFRAESFIYSLQSQSVKQTTKVCKNYFQIINFQTSSGRIRSKISCSITKDL